MRARAKEKMQDEETEEKGSCWELKWLDRYTQEPTKLYVVIWNFVALSMNLISIFIVFYECAFRLSAVEYASGIVMCIEFVLLFEIISIFFKAIPNTSSPRGCLCSLLGACGLCKVRKNEDGQRIGAKGQQWNTSFKEIALHYLSGSFITDFLSVIPFLIAKLAAHDTDYLELLDRGYMQIFAYLRLLRITQLPKILQASYVYAQILNQKFPNKRQMIFNANQVFSIVMFLMLSLHLSACGNIFQGMGEESWIKLDEDGRMLNEKPWDLYVNQMYFMTTTMTTIGYGDVSAQKYPDYSSADNMLLIFFIQFIAIGTFSLIQDRLFSI